MDTETEIKNKMILLSQIRLEIVEETKKLTSIKKAVEKERENIVLAVEQLTEIRTATDEELAALREEKKQLFQARKDLEMAENRAKEELNVLKKQKKEAIKELGRINDWVFTAKDELKDTKKENDRLMALNKKKVGLKNEIEKQEERLEALRFEAAKKITDAKLKMDEAVLKEAKVNELAIDARKKEEALLENLKKSRQELADTVKKKDRIEKDLAIYIERVEKHYKKAFPELKMNI